MTTAFTGIYEIPEAARYLRATLRLPEDFRYPLPSGKLIRWVRAGLANRELIEIPGNDLLIDFRDLVSLRVIMFLRALGHSFQKIREAETLLRSITKSETPFTTEPVWSAERSPHIFAEVGRILLAASHGGQMAFVELVQDKLVNVHGLTFDEDGTAQTWTPHKHVLMNPKIQFGTPCIANTRIPTSTLADMVRAGDRPDFVASIYRLALEEVQEALVWEDNLATSKKSSGISRR